VPLERGKGERNASVLSVGFCCALHTYLFTNEMKQKKTWKDVGETKKSGLFLT